MSHVVCAFYFTNRDQRPCLPIGLFFADLYDVLDRLDAFVEPLPAVHCWRPQCSSAANQLRASQSTYRPARRLRPGISCSRPNSRPRGLLDVVASRGHCPSMLSTPACLTTVFYAGEFPKDDRHQSAPQQSSDRGVSSTLRPSARRSVVVVTVPTDGLARLYTTLEICVCADDIKPESTSATSIYTSIATRPRRPMCRGPCPAVLRLCVTYAASVAPSLSPRLRLIRCTQLSTT